MLPLVIAMVAAPQDLVLKPGLEITSSVKVRKNEYVFPNADETATTGVIVVKGDGITVDFNGATLRGTSTTTEPDKRIGTAVYVEGINVTIKNLNAHGYKVGIAARNTPGLKIIDCDLSYNWKQRLLSTLDREDGSDWMSYHQNEKDEWLRFGAGIYLRNCDDFEVKGCTVTGGQNGLMMTECDDGLVWNNDFSFLSSLGIGMYRSSKNRVMHNSVDWCVRGYSHGVYNRGQDSAGILVYEQSNDNVFAYNSVTHGGDGFFLWAGQTTMDTGQGGCNGNLLFGNDFSHAPTNGIEATFSKNTFVNNLMLECWHGIWAGYSWETKVLGNTFGLNAEAIAWEHGQDNVIQYNVFNKDRMAIVLWQKDSEDPNWGYSKNRDTRSRNNTVSHNVFRDVTGPVFRVSRSADLKVTDNTFFRADQLFVTEKETPGLVIQNNKFHVPFRMALPVPEAENEWLLDPENKPAPTAMAASGNLLVDREKTGAEHLQQFQVGWRPFVVEDFSGVLNAHDDIVRPFAPAPIVGGKVPFIKPNELRGRKYILVDEWGPYDFRSPVLWPRALVQIKGGRADIATGRTVTTDPAIDQHFEVLGPKGTFRVVQTRGVNGVSTYNGTVPGTLVVRMDTGQVSDMFVELEYKGEATTDYKGNRTLAGQPVRFSYSKFFAPIAWVVKWFSYDRATQDPRYNSEWTRIITSSPLRRVETSELNFAWGGSPGEGVPADQFLTLAEGEFTIAAGDYELEITSDDGVRVILDGKVVLEDWTWHGPKTETRRVKLNGKHKLRVEHFELDGYAALKVVIKRRL